MPTLRNAKHERFAQERSTGSKLCDAYLAAGYSGSRAQATSHASRLAQRPEVAERITELQERMADKVVRNVTYDRDYVIENLKENLERALTNRPVLDRQGNPTGDYRYDGAVVNRAIELLGNELGMFVKETRRRETREFEDMSDDELAAAARAAADRIRALPAIPKTVDPATSEPESDEPERLH